MSLAVVIPLQSSINDVIVNQKEKNKNKTKKNRKWQRNGKQREVQMFLKDDENQRPRSGVQHQHQTPEGGYDFFRFQNR